MPSRRNNEVAMSSFFGSLLALVLILGCAAAVLIAYLISIHNKLVSLKARLENAFAQIEVQLTRRYDLIPNIVEVAKAYLKHENDTLLNVIGARNDALASLKAASAHPGDPASIEALNAAEKRLSGGLGGLRLQMEAYPELKGDRVMTQLSEELSTTENRVAFARQAFNDAVTEYNIRRNSFPSSIVANACGHTTDAALLQAENKEAIQAAPKISF